MTDLSDPQLKLNQCTCAFYIEKIKVNYCFIYIYIYENVTTISEKRGWEFEREQGVLY